MFFKDKKILVTGGSGFVGSHIVKKLLERGAKVRVPIHKRPMTIDDERVEIFSANLMKEQDCFKAVKGVDYVFHAAGAVGSAAVKVDKSMAAITANLVMTSLMLQAAWAQGVKRFLLFGSSTGYPVADYPIKEEEMWSGPTHPTYFGYGWMRRYLEKLGEFVASKSTVKIAIVRPSAVYGRRDNFNPATSHVIPALIRRAVEKSDPYEVWGTGDEVRDFLHVSDLVHGCLMILENYAKCEPLNIGYGKSVTIKEIVGIILKSADHGKARVIFDASKPTTIPFRMVDTAKAKKIMGFKPKVSMEEGLKDTVEWYTRYLHSSRS